MTRKNSFPARFTLPAICALIFALAQPILFTPAGASSLLVEPAQTASGLIETDKSSLDFGSMTQGQSKTLTFSVRSTVNLPVAYKVSVSAPYTVSPTSGSLSILDRADNVSVILPATASLGDHPGNVTIEAALSAAPSSKSTHTVALSSKVVSSPMDLSATMTFDSQEVLGTTRKLDTRIFCKVSGIDQTTAKTQVFVSRDGGAETEVMNLTTIYTSAGQIFVLGHSVPTSVRKVVFRVVVDPNNAAPETNENNNQTTLSLNF